MILRVSKSWVGRLLAHRLRPLLGALTLVISWLRSATALVVTAGKVLQIIVLLFIILDGFKNFFILI